VSFLIYNGFKTFLLVIPELIFYCLDNICVYMLPVYLLHSNKNVTKYLLIYYPIFMKFCIRFSYIKINYVSKNRGKIRSSFRFIKIMFFIVIYVDNGADNGHVCLNNMSVIFLLIYFPLFLAILQTVFIYRNKLCVKKSP